MKSTPVAPSPGDNICQNPRIGFKNISGQVWIIFAQLKPLLKRSQLFFMTPLPLTGLSLLEPYHTLFNLRREIRPEAATAVGRSRLSHILIGTVLPWFLLFLSQGFPSKLLLVFLLVFVQASPGELTKQSEVWLLQQVVRSQGQSLGQILLVGWYNLCVFVWGQNWTGWNLSLANLDTLQPPLWPPGTR